MRLAFRGPERCCRPQQHPAPTRFTRLNIEHQRQVMCKKLTYIDHRTMPVGWDWLLLTTVILALNIPPPWEKHSPAPSVFGREQGKLPVNFLQRKYLLLHRPMHTAAHWGMTPTGLLPAFCVRLWPAMSASCLRSMQRKKYPPSIPNSPLTAR